MLLQCFFDVMTDVCVGFVPLESGYINKYLPYMRKGEIIPLNDPRYNVHPTEGANYLQSISRNINLNTHPLGKDLNDLLFIEQSLQS